MVVGAIIEPPSFEGGRRFVLRAMKQTKMQVLNFADPVVQKQQMILKSLPAVRLQKHYVYLMASVSCIFILLEALILLFTFCKWIQSNSFCHETAKDIDSARILAIRCREELRRRGLPVPLICR